MGGDIFITGSMLWFIVMGIFGFTFGIKHSRWEEETNAAAKEGDLAKFWESYDGMKIKSISHAHGMGLSLVGFVLGLAMKSGYIGFSERFQAIIAVGFIIGMIVVTIGNRFRFEPLVAPGNVLVMLGLIACTIGRFV